MSPADAVIMIHNIESALSELDPANAADDRSRLAERLGKLGDAALNASLDVLQAMFAP